MKPLVSICCPTYNRSEYLAEMIASCQAQTYDNWELILVDDGSNDFTDKLLDYFTKSDVRIKYFKQKNQGIAAARNRAIKEAQGKYIAVMDSDDIMNPERLEDEVKILEKGKVDVVYGGYYRANEHAVVIDGINPADPPTLQRVKDNELPPHVTVMARSECFKNTPYRPEFTSNDDFALFWDWFKAGYTFKGLNKPLVIVRFHQKSTSVEKDKEIKELHQRIIKEIELYEASQTE